VNKVRDKDKTKALYSLKEMFNALSLKKMSMTIHREYRKLLFYLRKSRHVRSDCVTVRTFKASC
jgi:hypothetical protein